MTFLTMSQWPLSLRLWLQMCHLWLMYPWLILRGRGVLRTAAFGKDSKLGANLMTSFWPPSYMIASIYLTILTPLLSFKLSTAVALPMSISLAFPYYFLRIGGASF